METTTRHRALEIDTDALGVPPPQQTFGGSGHTQARGSSNGRRNQQEQVQREWSEEETELAVRRSLLRIKNEREERINRIKETGVTRIFDAAKFAGLQAEAETLEKLAIETGLFKPVQVEDAFTALIAQGFMTHEQADALRAAKAGQAATEPVGGDAPSGEEAFKAEG